VLELAKSNRGGVTMKSALCVFVVLGFALCTSTASAKEKQRLPLPANVLAAKTVFIDNQTGMAKLGDRAYEELKKWGRFQIVPDRKQADLIFLLTAQERDGGYVTSGGGQTGTVDSSGNINTSSNPTYTTHVTVGYTYLTVFDAKSGDNLWSESKRWGNLYTGFRSATKSLIDELKKRMDEQSKQQATSELKKP
jgi:hypothetical protein